MALLDFLKKMTNQEESYPGEMQDREQVVSSKSPILNQSPEQVKVFESPEDIRNMLDQFNGLTQRNVDDSQKQYGFTQEPDSNVDEFQKLFPKQQEVEEAPERVSSSVEEKKVTQTKKEEKEDPYSRQERMMKVGAIGDALSKIFTSGMARTSATPLANIDPNAFNTLKQIGGVGVKKFENEQKNNLQTKQMLSKLAQKSAEPSFAEKERIKLDVKQTLSDEKDKKEIKVKAKDALSSLDTQEQYIDKALKLLEDGAATGPLDQFIGKVTPSGQKLQKAINNISLDKMVKMFAGMSKAIDSDAERAFFQSTQPSMSDYENVNIDTLKALKTNISNLREKTKQAAVTGEKQIPDETSQSSTGMVMADGGQMVPEYTERNGNKYKFNKQRNKYQLAE